jgi:hypothetical protein
VNRGGWSLTVTILELLESAHVAAPGSFFFYLAGTDYPIRSRETIAAHLGATGPRSYVNHFPLLPGTEGYSNFARYHFVDATSALGPRRVRRRFAADEREYAWQGVVDWLNRRLPPREFPKGVVPFRGSSRWCLSPSAAEFVLAWWRSPSNREVVRYFRRTWGSDEMVVQTALFNSPIAASCRNFDAEEVREIIAGRKPPWPDEKKAFLHYIDWNPEREDPAVLDERDFDRLRSSEALFACKFLTGTSTRLLDRIDAQLRTERPAL